MMNVIFGIELIRPFRAYLGYSRYPGLSAWAITIRTFGAITAQRYT
jgi:hypothetical protein